MMEPLQVCLILLSVSSFCGEQHATALPASTVQVRVGEDAILQCPLLNASIANASIANASIANASIANASITDASITHASIPDASNTNASITDASTINASITNASIANASTINITTSAAPRRVASSTLSWYRKAAGQSPELLLSFRPADPSEVKYGTGVGPDKVSAAADGSLKLHDLERSDSAVYYCGITWGKEQKKKPMPRELTGE